MNKVSLIGPQTGRWAEQMIHQRGIPGVRVLLGLLSLSERHSAEAIEKACETALGYGAYRLRTIRELLKRQADRQEQFAFIEEHPIIRPLSEYGRMVRQSFAMVGETSPAGFPEPLPWASSPPPGKAEDSTSIGGYDRE
jgi:hypothetical protein